MHQVQRLPATVYDMARVKRAVRGVYKGDAILLQLYRLDQAAEVIKQKDAVERAQ